MEQVYASVINGVVVNAINVNPERLPRKREGETLIPMADLPAGAWTGWRFVDGAWLPPVAVLTSSEQDVLADFEVARSEIMNAEVEQILLKARSSWLARERDTVEAAYLALGKLITERDIALICVRDGRPAPAEYTWYTP
jgi:hypothetical protein